MVERKAGCGVVAFVLESAPMDLGGKSIYAVLLAPFEPVRLREDSSGYGWAGEIELPWGAPPRAYRYAAMSGDDTTSGSDIRWESPEVERCAVVPRGAARVEMADTWGAPPVPELCPTDRSPPETVLEPSPSSSPDVLLVPPKPSVPAPLPMPKPVEQAPRPPQSPPSLSVSTASPASLSPPPPSPVLATPTDVLCTGFLTKLGEVRKTWKRRFFILNTLCVLYYTKLVRAKPKGRIEIVDIMYVRAAVVKGKEAMFAFELVTKPRIFTLLAEKDDERTMWFDSFR
jgi:hypothetical protein